jgi:hypothetical protein
MNITNHNETQQTREKERVRVQTRCKVHALGEEESHQNSQSLIRPRTTSRDIHIYLESIIHLADEQEAARTKEEQTNKNSARKCKKEKGLFCSLC